MSFEIKKIDHKNIGEGTLAEMLLHTNIMRAERLPDDPPETLETFRSNLQNIPPVIIYHNWLVSPPGETRIIARASLVMVQMEENKHLGQVEIEVIPSFRRQGVGRSLLAAVIETASAAGRTNLLGNTSGRVPSGRQFVERIGGKKGLETHTNQLVIESLDRTLVQEWMERGQARGEGYELEFLDGHYPEEYLADMVHLLIAMNSQPTGELDIEDFHWTPEQIRQMDEMTLAGGRQRWTYYARDKASGNYAGYTEVLWTPSKPQYLSQQDTAVLPEFRGNGLGRWLKAAMLQKVLSDRPEVKFVRTGNADGNVPMLKINNELGFKPYQSGTVWQVEVSTAQNYLQVG